MLPVCTDTLSLCANMLPLRAKLQIQFNWYAPIYKLISSAKKLLASTYNTDICKQITYMTINYRYMPIYYGFVQINFHYVAIYYRYAPFLREFRDGAKLENDFQ